MTAREIRALQARTAPIGDRVVGFAIAFAAGIAFALSVTGVI